MTCRTQSAPECLAEVRPLRREPYPELVECLREKLAQAERGELVAFAYAAEYSNGDMGQITDRHLQPKHDSEHLNGG
jgi:hypothetical protein